MGSEFPLGGCLLLITENRVGWETHLFDLVFVSLVGAGPVVGERFWACEFVVGGWGGYYVAMASYLTGETADGAGD